MQGAAIFPHGNSQCLGRAPAHFVETQKSPCLHKDLRYMNDTYIIS